jgi:SAM-dependent methyltransferase
MQTSTIEPTRIAATPISPGFDVRRYWLTGVEVGLKSIFRQNSRVDGLKRVVNPLSFPRPAEFRAALYDLAPALVSGRVLDIGSPKLPVALLARERPGLELHATDIMEVVIASTRRVLEAAGCAQVLDRGIYLRTEDARSLSYADESFDWVYSISVLEHVADQRMRDTLEPGDSAAMQEIARVLRPGGVVTLTVPMMRAGTGRSSSEGPSTNGQPGPAARRSTSDTTTIRPWRSGSLLRRDCDLMRRCCLARPAPSKSSPGGTGSR